MNLLQSYITQHVPELRRDTHPTPRTQYYDYILDKYPDDVLKIELYGNSTNTLNFSTIALQRFTRLETFVCIFYNLTSLPNLPNTLKKLHCNGNKLTSLPPLPNGLLELSCYNNYLTSLPPLPNGLLELLCSDNRLTSLPLLPITLNVLACRNNLFPPSYRNIESPSEPDIQVMYSPEPDIQRFNIKIHPELAPQAEQIMQQAQEIQFRREQEEERRQQERRQQERDQEEERRQQELQRRREQHEWRQQEWRRQQQHNTQTNGIQQLPNFEFGTNVGAITDCSNANDDDPISMEPINEAGIKKLVKMSNGKCYYYEDLKRWALQNPIFPDTRQELTSDDLALLGLLKRQAGGRRRRRCSRKRRSVRRKRRTRARAKV